MNRIIFNRKQKESTRQRAALFLAIILILESAYPTAALALTSGPTQPEFGSFEPVNTNSMVNEFTGDFTYNIPVINIPGANGGGYAMSLSYHSGENVESEASWVGYGWTLNPGSIIRGKRGFADDTKNTVTYFNDVPSNWTASTGASVGNIEAFSFQVPLSANASIRYNNYTGFGYTAGAGLSIRQGLVTLGYSVSDGQGSFSAQVNPAALLSSKEDKKKKDDAEAEYKKAGSKEEAKAIREKYAKDNPKKKGSSFLKAVGSMASSYGMYALSNQQKPTTVTPYYGKSFNANFNLQTSPAPFEIGPQFGFTGNYNEQKNIAVINRKGYGYLYSYDAYSDAQGVMDYYTERNNMYTKRDMYLSIPFSNADAFSVSGEGVGGGFRLHSSRSGTFRPNTAKSITDIQQVAADVNVGLEFGGGANIGLGQQSLNIDGETWADADNSIHAQFLSSGYSGEKENYFFRFNGDLGGDVNFDNTNSLSKADIVLANSGFPGAKKCRPEFNSTLLTNLSLSSATELESGTVNRSGRSSYIGYHTNAEITTNQKAYAYEKSNDYVLNSTFSTGLSVDRSKPEQIGEVATVTGDGATYVYGLPVSCANEKSLQYDLSGISGNDIDYNFLAYKDVDAGHKMKIGQVENGSYYTSYLLTQITGADYVDRTMNGPTPDDFGSYTKFQYEQLYKVAAGNGFHYRSPYTGLNYSKGEVSDKSDDMGAYSSGDKDIYYLKQIVTNSHIARFITSDRKDGIEAASDATADNSSTAKGTKTLKKLERIELYTNNNGQPGKLIKKVIFKYDYSLCKGLPNSNGTGNSTGKLTLKELWFEHDGIVSAKISPYQFNYEYPTIASGIDYPEKYDYIQDEYLPFATSQNPNYSPFAIDGWGNYQDATSGQTRFNQLKAWVNQTPPSDFDPAAWQLKQIKLPSGGEIHVQYEQDNYLYVQDRRAEALVSLSSGQDQEFGLLPDRKYELNTADIGVSSPSEKAALVALIKQRYTNKKIYFKFLYALLGTNPALDKCNSDYISGYVNFLDAYINNSGNVEIKIGNPGASDYGLPRQICLDLVKKQKGGKLNPFGNCDADENGVQNGQSVKDIVSQLISKIGVSFFSDGLSCLEVNSALSYFKIPCLKAKKGGGIRVKRLLMFDKNGIDTNTSALYGSEYLYQEADGSSSGVATNEPASMRDENALITFMPQRTDQKFLSKAISGTDREQFEGPIGESLLPAASVGYRRVITKNIHNGKTNTGFIVNEFNTVKDYPFDMQYDNGSKSGVSYTQIDQEKDWMNLPAIVLNYNVANVWASQGYRFILNSMHGQPKSVKTYAGEYTSGNGGVLSTYYESSSTEYEYFEPGEPVNVKKADGSIVQMQAGKEMEVVFEKKQVEDVTVDGSIEVDFGVGMAGIIPLPQASLSPLLNYNESKLRTHVTTKVIQYPVIQRRVKTKQEGIVHITENVAFNAATGNPIVVRTSDGYNGLDLPNDNSHNGVYTAYTIPAYTQYTDMGQKASNERFSFSTAMLNAVTYQALTNKLVFSQGPSACDALKLISKGDLLAIKGSGAGIFYFHVTDVNGYEVSLALTANLNTSASITNPLTKVEIVRSGKANLLNVAAGSYVTYGQSNSTNGSLALSAEQQTFINDLNTALAGLQNSTISTANISTCLNGGRSGKITFSKTASPPYMFSISFPQADGKTCGINDLPYLATGSIYVDPISGLIKYKTDANACVVYTLPACMQFCAVGNTPFLVTKVISASAQTLEDKWDIDAGMYPAINLPSGLNDYENGRAGRWKVLSSYVYNSPVTGGAKDVLPDTERNYKDAGTYTLELFNWKNTGANSAKWIKTSTVTKYSPAGEALEEQDALGMYSSAKLGYKNMVPYLVAQNSAYTFSAFESFENIYGAKFEDGVVAVSSQHDVSSGNKGHSGKGTYKLSGSGNFRFNSFNAGSSIAGSTNGMSLKVWVKDNSNSVMPLKGNLLKTGASPATTPLTFKKVAQTGEWTLYEAIEKNLQIGATYQFELLSNLASGTIHIDDVRQQPLNTQMVAYVYDPTTLRLLTSFDDQHFGVFYQYNQEGKLVRKMIETERGMKTVTESQYNSPRKERSPNLE
ncbi:MAG: hypothetical protein QM534_16220 [Sediminibacterium sp.]|nr:hypothetical protein [Sediminibacterium sp.]